jgi:hypothetical protein
VTQRHPQCKQSRRRSHVNARTGMNAAVQARSIDIHRSSERRNEYSVFTAHASGRQEGCRMGDASIQAFQ